MTEGDLLARPQMWLSLPPGFFLTALLDDEEEQRALAALTKGLSAPAVRAVTQAMTVAQEQAKAQAGAGLTLSAAGVHPRADGGVDRSTLVAGVRAFTKGPKNAVLLTAARAEEARTETEKVFVRDFRAGPAVVAERHLTALTTPSVADTGADAASDASTDTEPVSLHSVRVTFVTPDSAHLAVVELATTSADSFAGYRDVMLELIAPSVTFEHPEQATLRDSAAARRQGRLVDRLGGRTVAVDAVGKATPDNRDGNEGGHGDG